MSVFTFHLVKTNVMTSLSAMFSPPGPSNVPGMIHAECMSNMQLGSPIISTLRMQLQQLAFFAAWENEEAIDHFFVDNKLGKKLAKGWHVRLSFLRRWGDIKELEGLFGENIESELDKPVVAVTLARMKILQVPRFIRWGRPVEQFVRDHSGITLATAAMRFPNTVSTFSVWKTQREMLEMVHGKNKLPKTETHAEAMKERQRKDFHHEFTTLRFKPLSEHGEWNGRKNIVPFMAPGD